MVWDAAMKKGKKLLLWGLCVAAVLLLTVLAMDGWVRYRAGAYVLEPEEAGSVEADCILVLGCGVRPDGTPSLMLRDRLDMGIALYEAGAAPKLLMSGDHSQEYYDEVNTMKNWAKAAGVPSEDIFMDHAGFSTYESMYRARDVFQVRKVLIVSQAYHLYRAVYDARQLGLEAWGVAAEDVAYLGQAYRNGREILARCKDLIYCVFQPEPTFLGDPIPVSGSGDLTND